MAFGSIRAGLDGVLAKVFEHKKIIVATAALVFVVWKGKSVVRKRKLRSLIRVRLEERKKFIEELRKHLNGASQEVRERRKAIAALKFGQLRDELQKGTVSAKEALEAYQWKALEANDLNNNVCLFFPQALEWAEELDRAYKGEEKPALFGIPISIKETVNVQGFDSSRGYPQCLFDPASKDAEVVASLRRYGAVPFVHTNIPEGLFWFGCSNPVYGTTKNPHDPKRTSGGSSGGEASLLASGGSIVGIGGDIGGSIRIPSHFCGIVGFKPSSTRLSQIGSISSVPGRPRLSACLGPMAREVDAVATLMRLLTTDEKMHEADPFLIPFPWRRDVYEGEGGKKLKIGYYTFDKLLEAAPACQRAVEEAKKILVKKGHMLIPYQPPNTHDLFRLYLGAGMVDGADYLYRMATYGIVDPLYAPIVRLYGMPSLIRRLIGHVVRPINPIASTLLLSAPRTITEVRSIYEQAEKARRHYIQAWKEAGFDAIICPAFATVALPHQAPVHLSPAMSYTAMFNLVDVVAGVVPVTKVILEDEQAIHNGIYKAKEPFSKEIAKYCGSGTVGLPVDVQCVTLPNQEETCLRVMKEIEEGRGF